MQAYTSPVPAYLRSGLLPHLLSICTPHLWARMLPSLFRSSARQWWRDAVKRRCAYSRNTSVHVALPEVASAIILLSSSRKVCYAAGFMIEEDVPVVEEELLNTLHVCDALTSAIGISHKNIGPHAARALFCPAQNWMFQQYDVFCNTTQVQSFKEFTILFCLVNNKTLLLHSLTLCSTPQWQSI